MSDAPNQDLPDTAPNQDLPEIDEDTPEASHPIVDKPGNPDPSGGQGGGGGKPQSPGNSGSAPGQNKPPKP